MLQPANRLTLIEAMRPPAGFDLDAAMAVTFTLDLRALLAAPAAFALSNSTYTSEDSEGSEPVDLLHAVRSYANKLTVLSQVGEIALPPSRRVFAFLEPAVLPVSAPLGGVVHPKVWVLRYIPVSSEAGDEARLRVLVASRNLTFDSSWDTVVRLDESENGGGADLSGVGDLFTGLLATAPVVSTEHRHRVAGLASSVRSARFALPPGVDALDVHVLGLEPGGSPLPATAERSLIISPFLGDDFFDGVNTTPITELVSRPESLDALSQGARSQIKHPFEFDDGSVADFDGSVERLSELDPGRPIVGLHAKVFAFEDGRDARVFLGSANATGAAFTRNVEILLELGGSIDCLGIDQLCDGTADEDGLRARFVPYRQAEPPPDEPDDRDLQGARRQIAGLEIVGTVSSEGESWGVTYSSSGSVPATADSEIQCWPLASPGNRRAVDGGTPLDVHFEVTLETISGFLAFEIKHVNGKVTEFVVPVTLDGVPEDRDRMLMRALIGGADRFLRYLLAVLDDESVDRDFAEIADRIGDGASEGTSGGPSLPVLEKMLRTLRRDPARLEGLHPLVVDLERDDALPEGFAQLWSVMYDLRVVGGDR